MRKRVGFLLAVLVFAACAKEKVIFDTDIGGDVDDALALVYLLSHKDCELLGITIEAWGGNGPRQAEIASAICRDRGVDVPIKIGPGAGNLKGRRAKADPEKPPRYWHIVEGRDYEKFDKRNDAIDFLRKTIRENKGEVTLVATGHFTNIAALFACDPEIPSLLKRLVLMGGDMTGKGEWNASYDPVATAVAFGNGNHSRPPQTLALGFDVTGPHHVSPEEGRKLMAGVPALKLSALAAEAWYKTGNDLYFHDPMATAVIFKPEIATWTNASVAVDISKNAKMRIEKKRNPDHDVLKIAVSIDRKAFLDEFLGALSRD